ncbi:MAG: 50S ribosomal protein L11 [Thermoprotei archaeon]
MANEKTLKFIIDGGKATGGPPIGPALGPLGVDVMDVVNTINNLTKEFGGMKVPVEVTVNLDTKEFKVSVGIPTTAALLLKELKAEKGAESPAKNIGNLSIEQVIKIAKIKIPDMLSKHLKSATKEVLGTCLSLGIKVENQDPREVIKMVNAGKFDDLIKKYEAGEG